MSSPSPPVLECDVLLCDVLLCVVLERDTNLVSIRKQRVDTSLEATRSLVSNTHRSNKKSCLKDAPNMSLLNSNTHCPH